MWLITTFIAAVIVTICWIVAPRRYRLDILGLMLWGATIMILVDHVFGHEGEFFKMETEGMISNGILLGLVMLVPVFVVWAAYLFFSRKSNESKF